MARIRGLDISSLACLLVAGASGHGGLFRRGNLHGSHQHRGKRQPDQNQPARMGQK